MVVMQYLITRLVAHLTRLVLAVMRSAVAESSCRLEDLYSGLVTGRGCLEVQLLTGLAGSLLLYRLHIGLRCI